MLGVKLLIIVLGRLLSIGAILGQCRIALLKDISYEVQNIP